MDSPITVHEAHADGRHASTNRFDRDFWIKAGCTACAALLPGESGDPHAEWVFEGPDPEVGIFGTLIIHTCTANDDGEDEAEITSVQRTTSEDGRFVIEETFLRCPTCKATTSVKDKWPVEWFR